MGSEEIYKRPGKVENKQIGKLDSKLLVRENSNKRVTLKENLQEIYDYVTVDHESWVLLKQWYGYDYSVPLKMNRKETN
jgi:hypothetical protein